MIVLYTSLGNVPTYAWSPWMQASTVLSFCNPSPGLNCTVASAPPGNRANPVHFRIFPALQALKPQQL